MRMKKILGHALAWRLLRHQVMWTLSVSASLTPSLSLLNDVNEPRHGRSPRRRSRPALHHAHRREQ